MTDANYPFIGLVDFRAKDKFAEMTGSQHNYARVPLVGPVDSCSKGLLWDPRLNYLAVSYDRTKEYRQQWTVLRNLVLPSESTPEMIPTDEQQSKHGLTEEEIFAVLDFPGHFVRY